MLSPQDNASSSTTTWAGAVDARRCAGTPQPVALRRCTVTSAAEPVALAVCGALAADNTLTVETAGRDVAVSGQSRIASPLHVGGSFTSLGGIRGDNTVDVGGDLRTSGAWSVSAPARVAGDAYAGTLRAQNSLDVGGVLHTTSQSGSGSVTASSTLTGSFAVSSPLDCANAVNVATLAKADANNDAIVVASPADVTLGCGEYVVAGIEANKALTFHVMSDAVLVVRGDLHVAAPTRFLVDDGVKLDVVVGGSLLVDNTLSFEGGPTWLGVSGMIHIAAPTTLTGWLVAPTSDVGADNTLVITGGAFVGSLRVAAPVALLPGGSVDATGCVTGG